MLTPKARVRLADRKEAAPGPQQPEGSPGPGARPRVPLVKAAR